MGRRPLDGIRVLDLTRLLPGPFCTLWLADLGADVVKIEEVGGGDWVRALPPQVGDSGALFHALNRSKRSLALDLKAEEGKDVFLTLAADADVVVETFRPGVMDRLGIGWEALHEANPRLIYCPITGFGQTGPLAQRAGHDLTYEAIAGLLGVTGREDQPPVIPGIPVADHVGAVVGVVAVLGALLNRAQTGVGERLDVSLTDSVFSMMLLHLAEQLVAGGEPPKRGRVQLTGSEPNYAVYTTRDGRHLAVGALEPKFWQRFCAAIEREDLVGEVLAMQADPTRRQQVSETLQEIIGSRSLAEWIRVFEQADCCVEPVAEGAEIVAHPNNVARDLVFGYSLSDGSSVQGIRAPVRPWALDGGDVRPAPSLGEHTDEVLEAAGIDEHRREALREQGVIR